MIKVIQIRPYLLLITWLTSGDLSWGCQLGPEPEVDRLNIEFWHDEEEKQKYQIMYSSFRHNVHSIILNTLNNR